MKKILSLFLLLSTVAVTCSFAVYAKDEIKVFVNDTLLVFDQPPILVNGRTLVPIRSVCEALGADVYWAEETQGICIVKNQTKLLLGIGSNKMTVFSCANFQEFLDFAQNLTAAYPDKIKERLLDTAPAIYNNRTLLPVRAVCEELGANVNYDDPSKSVLITCSQELIHDKNKDTEFFEKFTPYARETEKSNTIKVYNHRGQIEIFPKDKNLFSDIDYYFFSFIDDQNINMVNTRMNEQSITIDIEFTDNINVETVISDYVNNDTAVTIRNTQKEIIFGMDDLQDMGFYSYEMAFSVSLKDKNANTSEDLFLYIDDEYIGKCHVTKNDSGVFLDAYFDAYIEKNVSTAEYFYLVSPYARRVISKNGSRKIEKINFLETPCKQYDENVIFAVLGEDESAFCRNLSQHMNKNFGVAHGILDRNFKRGYANVLISGNTENYNNTANYYKIGIKKGANAFYIIIKNSDNKLYKEILSALKNMPDYEYFLSFNESFAAV